LYYLSHLVCLKHLFIKKFLAEQTNATLFNYFDN
jgi:hypothetical protein